jgi:FKBP-type peptidyl-prolyl cis-trans isomerase
MRLRHLGAALCFALLPTACESGSSSSESAALDTDDQKASYGIGRDMGTSLQPARNHLDMPAFMRGLEDALAERESTISEQELQETLQRFSQTIMAEQQSEQAAMAETNLQAGEAFLAENGAREGVVTTASGLQYEVLREGDGPTPSAEDQVRLHYRGTLIDGTEFDSSHGGDPVVFAVGRVITGFSEGLQVMNVGGQYRLYIPGHLGYGLQGTGGVIGPNQLLIFEIELMGIE